MSRILIVEPDCLVAKNLAATLKRHGFSAVHTADAQAAINAADTQTPDAVILDLMLAGRSGIEFLYELRSYPDWAEIPVLVYSNLSPLELPIETACFTQLGITRVFYKPNTKISELIEELEYLLRPLAQPVNIS